MGHVQIITNLVDYGMDLQQAIDAPRFFIVDDQTIVERGVPRATVEGLQARGHDVALAHAPWGGAQAIHIDWRRGVLIGGSDPRKAAARSAIDQLGRDTIRTEGCAGLRFFLLVLLVLVVLVAQAVEAFLHLFHLALELMKLIALARTRRTAARWRLRGTAVLRFAPRAQRRSRRSADPGAPDDRPFPPNDTTPIVTNAGGCRAHRAATGRLLAEDRAYAKSARHGRGSCASPRVAG